MKKTLTLLAILAAIGPAWGADVVSSNIVGYEKVSLTKGYSMIGVQFVQVGGGSQDLSSVAVLDDSMAGFDEDGNYATIMEVWNGNGYDTYGWSGTSAGVYMDDETLNNKWLNLSYEASEEEIGYGHAVWIKAAGTGKITFTSPANTGN